MATMFRKDVIDPETGEVIKAIAFIPEQKDKGFVKVFKLFGSKVLEDIAELNGGEAKLLLWLMAKTLDMPYQSDLWIPVDYNEVAKEIGISVVSVKRYFRNLLHLGYIEQFRPRNTTFRMKPEYLYKGILVKYQTDTVESLIKKGRKKVAK